MISDGDIDGLGAVMAEDFVEHEDLAPGHERSKAGVLEFFHLLRSLFGDTRMEVVDLIDAEDKVVSRVRITGTHPADFMGIPATGNQVESHSSASWGSMGAPITIVGASPT